MKAELGSPGSKDIEILSKERVRPVKTGSLWAHIRRIEARLDAIELRTSTVAVIATG